MYVALGKAEADLAVINGSMVNVYTGEVLTGQTVLVKGDRIAYVGEDAGGGIGSGTEVIDAAGKTLIPGLIDGHTHIACEYSIQELLRYAMLGGVTTIFTETAELAFAAGYAGILEFLRSIQNQPVKVFATVPPMVSISPAAASHATTVKELRRLYRRKEVVGLGEPYWAPVVNGDARVLDLIAETVRAGKKAEGHSSGARGRKLQAYLSTGVSSCHEPITADEAAERLGLGLYTLIREGEIRRELEAVAAIKDRNISLRRLAITTDGIGPWQLVRDGYLEAVLQKAINLGFDPVTAIQMATLNVAQRFGMDDSIGGIAPARFADMVIIPDIRTIKPEYVISNGQVVAKQGELVVQPRKHIYSRSVCNSVKLPRSFAAEDFSIPVPGAASRVKVRVIEQTTHLVTREAIIDMPVVDGQLNADTGRDVIKVAAIERLDPPGKKFIGLIKGIGLRGSAIATSATWDSSNLIVIGDNDADMARATNRVRELEGGITICSGGRIIAEMAMPVGGVISTEPMEVISDKLEAIQRAAASLGCVSPDIRLTLATLPSAAVAHFRICESGLFSLRENRFVDLIVEGS